MLLPRTVIAEADWVQAQAPADWLTPGELHVYAVWASDTRRAEWLAGRLAAKKLLRQEFGLDPLAWFVGRDGVAPAVSGYDLPGVTLSLSHSSGMGAATVSDTHAEGSAGVDIQRIRPVHPGFCARVFTQEEREQIASQFGAENDPAGMLLLWSLKEAAIKARREAWGRSLQALRVTLTRPGCAEVTVSGEAIFPAQYARFGDWWAARVVQPPRPNSGEPCRKEMPLTL